MSLLEICMSGSLYFAELLATLIRIGSQEIESERAGLAPRYEAGGERCMFRAIQLTEIFALDAQLPEESLGWFEDSWVGGAGTGNSIERTDLRALLI